MRLTKCCWRLKNPWNSCSTFLSTQLKPTGSSSNSSISIYFRNSEWISVSFSQMCLRWLCIQIGHRMVVGWCKRWGWETAELGRFTWAGLGTPFSASTVFYVSYNPPFNKLHLYSEVELKPFQVNSEKRLTLIELVFFSMPLIHTHLSIVDVYLLFYLY